MGVVYLAYIIQIMDWVGYCKLIKGPIAASIGVPRVVYRTALRRMPKFKFFFFPESLPVFIQLCSRPEFLEFSFERFAFRKFNSFRNFRKLFREISVPFAAVSKFSKVLVEWKAPLFFRTEYSK